MKVKFVDWGAAYKKQKKELDLVWKRLNSEGQLLLRDEVEQFEESLAKICGTKYAIGVNSGSDALWLSLLAAGIKQGDEVITVSHTFIATIQAIERVGAVPVFVDVGTDELMNVYQIEGKITPKTKALLPVHLTGKMCDMDRIMEIAKKYNLVVIEDAAQAFGASLNGKRAGSFGDFGCFSFYPFKILGCAGDGGGITTSNPEYAKKLRLLRNHGNVSQTGMDTDEKGEVRYAWNSRLDNIHAGTLNVRLKEIESIWLKRREFAKLYDEGLLGLPIALPSKQGGRVYQEYVIQAPDRIRLTQYLNKNGIEVLPNIKQQTAGLKPNHFIWGRDDLPQTQHFTETNIRLPIWPTLTTKQILYVIKTIKAYYQ